MIVLGAGMNKINNELRRTQNELTMPEFEHFALFAWHDFFHRKERKGRKDSLIGIYAINHREKLQSISIPRAYERAEASRFRMLMTWISQIFTDIFGSRAYLFHPPNNKPHRIQIANLCALRVLCCGLTLFPANDANGEME